jgi:hypothetical protein
MPTTYRRADSSVHRLKNVWACADNTNMSDADDFPLVSGLSSVLGATATNFGPCGFAITGQQQWDAICQQADRLRADDRGRRRDIAALERMLHGSD